MGIRWETKVHYPTKSITVIGEFYWPPNVSFKIKATYEEWRSWYKIHLNPTCDISITSILTHIIRPRKNDIAELKRYAYDEPCDFLWDFYTVFLIPTYRLSPLTGNKSRRLHHSISTTDFRYIVICARWLYVLLEHWKKVPARQWPATIKDFAKLHDLTINKEIPTSCILVEALNSLFDIELGEDSENYCHDHIRGEDIKVLREMLKTINHLPHNYPLNILFENLSKKERLRKLTDPEK